MAILLVVGLLVDPFCLVGFGTWLDRTSGIVREETKKQKGRKFVVRAACQKGELHEELALAYRPALELGTVWGLQSVIWLHCLIESQRFLHQPIRH